MKGVNIFIIVFLCSTIVALTGSIDLYQALRIHFMGNLTVSPASLRATGALEEGAPAIVEVVNNTVRVVTESGDPAIVAANGNPGLGGFTGFMRANYLIFLTGTLLGKMMEITKAAQSIAQFFIKIFGKNNAVISIPLACGVLGYGGVSAFVISFCVFPIALQIFKESDLPRRYMPGTLIFGCSTFAMIAPGALQIHNAIPSGILGTELSAGMVNGFLSCGAMLALGLVFLVIACRGARARGEGFVAKPMDVFITGEQKLPHWFVALIPLVVTITLVNLKITNAAGAKVNIVFLESGLVIGSIVAYLLMHQYQEKDNNLVTNLADSCKNSMNAICNTCAVVGFGSVVQATVGFPVILQSIREIPGPDLVGVAVAMNVVAGICGSASGALGIATKAISDAYQGVSAAAMHRVLAIASAGLDTLPHNGYVVTVTNGICNETHKDSYPFTFVISILSPLFGLVVAVILFTMFPNLP